MTTNVQDDVLNSHMVHLSQEKLRKANGNSLPDDVLNSPMLHFANEIKRNTNDK